MNPLTTSDILQILTDASMSAPAGVDDRADEQERDQRRDVNQKCETNIVVEEAASAEC